MIPNQNSLDNLKKDKPAHHEYGFQYSIPVEKIDKLFLLLANDTPLTVAAKEVGIKFETAKKYFEIGDPRRCIQPLKQRLAVLRYKYSEKVDNSIIRRRRYLLALVRRLVHKLRKELLKSDSGPKATYAALTKLIGLEVQLMGKLAPKSGEGELLAFTAEDIKTLASKIDRDNEMLGRDNGLESNEGTGDPGMA